MACWIHSVARRLKPSSMAAQNKVQQNNDTSSVQGKIHLDRPVSKTVVISNGTVSIGNGSVTVGDKIIKTQGDVSVSASCTRTYIVVIDDDGDIHCGYEDECTGMSVSEEC